MGMSFISISLHVDRGSVCVCLLFLSRCMRTRSVCVCNLLFITRYMRPEGPWAVGGGGCGVRGMIFKFVGLLKFG